MINLRKFLNVYWVLATGLLVLKWADAVGVSWKVAVAPVLVPMIIFTLYAMALVFTNNAEEDGRE